MRRATRSMSASKPTGLLIENCRNLPMPTGHAMLALPMREAPGGDARHIQGQKSPAQGGTEIFKMKLKHIVGLLSAVAIAGPAVAQDKTVKIGAIFPLSGN